jgi:outer membrane protein OmpA-like peptidoglycan-associated protein
MDTNEKVLSLNRAKAIFEYLVSNGISAGRMTYKGFGSQNRLINPERSESDASINRRVEFKITKR